MADPLSITASVAGIISLADVVFTRICKYAKAAGSDQQDVRDLFDEVKTIRDLLRALSALASKLDATPVTTTFNLSHIIACHETIQRLEDSLSQAQEDFERNKVRRFLRKLKWPFTATETRELLNNLARQKGNIGLSLGTDCISLILAELPRLNRLETSVTQISNGIQNMSVRIQNIFDTAQLVDPYFKQVVIRSFMPVDPEPQLQRNLAKIHEGSHHHILKEPAILLWRNRPGAKLSITGQAGVGKTTVASSLVQEALFRRTMGPGVAYLYCLCHDARTQSPTQILGALAAQLANQSNEAYGCLQQYYKRLHPLEDNSMNTLLSVDLMVSTFQHATRCFERVFIIVDGLDECRIEGGQVIDLLTRAGNMSHISMVLLNRNFPGLEQHLGTAHRWDMSLAFQHGEVERPWFKVGY
ncbi:hypothetical protein ACHAPU_011261 [Fusarium lateritium]